MKVRITQTLIWEYETRSLNHAPYGRFEKAGTYEINETERQEMIADCEYQGNIGGDWIDPISSGVTKAYRSLHKQLTAA